MVKASGKCWRASSTEEKERMPVKLVVNSLWRRRTATGGLDGDRVMVLGGAGRAGVVVRLRSLWW
jgi:hypothetical protein